MELVRAREEKVLEKYEDLKVITFNVDTSTSELAALALNVAVGQIAKSFDTALSITPKYLLEITNGKMIDATI